MKTKRVFWAVAIAAIIFSIILISLKAYYVTVALIAGVIIIGHREFWSLIRKRKLPPIDERVRANTSKAVRNGFIFFAIASAFLMLPFSVGLIRNPDTVHVLGGLFLSGGTVYLLSYIFYDRVEPRQDDRWSKLLRTFLLVTGISLGAFIISVFLHNAIYGLLIHWFGADFWDRTGVADEPVFFFIALLSVAAFAVGIIGSLVVFIKGLFNKTGEKT